jgi:hypothetical protein
VTLALGVLHALILAGAPDPRPPGKIADELLAAPKYGFCHDPQYSLTDDEAAWCPPFAPDNNPRCPQFHRACQAPRAVLDLDLGRLSTRSRGDGEARGDDGKAGRERQADGWDDSKDSKDAATPDDRPARRDPDRYRPEPVDPGMPAFAGLGELLFWVILGLGLAALIAVILRNTASAPTETQPEPTEAPPDGAAPTNTAEAEAVVRDVDVLLARARDAARLGDYAAAIRLAHAALLRRLDGDGLIRLDKSRTHGDYLIDLRDKPELVAPVRDVLVDIDRVHFGSEPAGPAIWERIYQRAAKLASRAAVLALGTWLALACDPTPPAPWDTSPSGLGAGLRLAALAGVDLDFREAPLSELGKHEDLNALILLREASPSPAGLDHLYRWASDGHDLVLTAPQLAARLDISATTAPGELVAHETEPSAFPVVTLRLPGASALSLTPGVDATVLLSRGDQPYAVAVGHGRGRIFVLADDRLFTNAALMLDDNPAALGWFLRELAHGGRVELVDGIADLGDDAPLDIVTRTHLTAAILQLLALLALIALWRGVRFGRPVDPPRETRRQFGEHTVALGQLYARARASRHALRLYAGWALDRLRERTVTQRQPGLLALAQAITSRTGDDETAILQLLVEASALRDEPPGPADPAGDLKTVRALARLLHKLHGPPGLNSLGGAR